jgi:peptidoglycan/xylan/chitin deacetylase (PgdA/CDA1 family)
MRYEKEALTLDEQVELLRSRGLQGDLRRLHERLRDVSYYRLTGYLRPFRDTNDRFRLPRARSLRTCLPRATRPAQALGRRELVAPRVRTAVAAVPGCNLTSPGPLPPSPPARGGQTGVVALCYESGRAGAKGPERNPCR